MSDALITRRAWLLAALPAGPVRTQDVERLLADSPFSCHRNTARKDLRGLCRAGLLAAQDDGGRRTYTRTTLERAA